MKQPKYHGPALLRLSPLFLAITLAACGSDSDNKSSSADTTQSLEVAADSSYTVSSTTTLDSLTIASGATLAAEDGKSLTMTVDGVETPLAEGSYSGTVVLTPTDNIEITYGELDPHYFRTAVYVEDGAYVASKSVASAYVDGEVTDSSLSGGSITSVGEKFNGIMVTSSADNTDTFDYDISDVTINFTGNGGNDFAGFGAAIYSNGYANVNVENATIETTGAVRTAVFVDGNSTMSVNNSNIEVHNGTLPEDYVWNVNLGEMMEVPWMLGLTGNVRATNLVGQGTAYYNNSTIKAQGWGVLSTDDTESVRLYCINSTLETSDSGYGGYSIGDAVDTFSNCKLNVNDYGLIMAAEGAGTFTDGTVVNSDRFGVMLHSNGNGTLRIERGAVFNTGEAVIQAKGSFPTIEVDNASLNSANGVILQLMPNDDPYFAQFVAMFPELGGSTGSSSSASFTDVTLSGDIIHGNTASGDLNVTLASATLTGAITTATTAFQFELDGLAAADVTADQYYYIGQVQNTFEATGEDGGLFLTMDGSSSWVVDTTSYLNSITIEDGASITAASGKTLTMLVDGVETAIAAGTYTNVVMQVASAE
ncbi:hypothetical protein [Parathalassolituus penaei]|uniref:Lipoprotein n=1 Tax=Parathalassolituus penaei TaxID=2997323 RepID=A0A9X3IUI0_9GAMM|nr:hypothetical protein [Parathalassolituus penaei]MCY0967385.1 hypothetical protein [Parathalassolituus penaei]